MYLLLYFFGNFSVVGHQELVVELELEDGVLRDVVVGHRLLEQVDLVQQELPDFGHRSDLEFVDDVTDVVAGSSVWREWSIK